jgi:hypothetical protein
MGVLLVVVESVDELFVDVTVLVLILGSVKRLMKMLFEIYQFLRIERVNATFEKPRFSICESYPFSTTALNN